MRAALPLLLFVVGIGCSVGSGDTDKQGDSSPTDSTTDDTGATGDDNPAPLTECPATLAPDTLCAEVEGYGITVFSIWQARANVVDSRTDEPTGQQDTVSLQLKGEVSGSLESGSFTCGIDNVFVYFGLRAGSPDYALWSAGEALGDCTMTYKSAGHIDLEASGEFAGTLELVQGDGVPTRTISGQFQLHGS